MEANFIYTAPVTGKNFIGRENDVVFLSSLLSEGGNAVIYDAPKSGKTSLINQAFFTMKMSNIKFSVAEVSLMNIRTVADFLIKTASKVLECKYSTPDELSDNAPGLLRGSHLSFDPENYASKGIMLKIEGDIDENDLKCVLTLPYRIGTETDRKIYVVLEEFQNIMQTEDGEWVCLTFEEVLKNLDRSICRGANYIFCGSAVNAMKEIFEKRRFFHRLVTRCRLEQIQRKDIVEHVVRGFLSGGKVVDRDLVIKICNLLRNDIWRISHFCAICDSKARGYIMEPVFVESLNDLTSIFEPEFRSTMNDLTTYQIFLLKAIMDGNTKFSSSEVIRHYNLNSSANVRRLKDALCKKEIVTFDERDEPHIIDPLFEYWVSKYYFQIRNCF